MTRHEALQEALASLRIEGLVPNAANMRLLQEWASHRMSADAVIAAATRSKKKG